MNLIKYIMFLIFISFLLIMPASATTYDLYSTDPPGTAENILKNQAQSGDIFFFHEGAYTRNELGIFFNYISKNYIVIEGENLSTVAFDLGDSFEIWSSGVILNNIRFIPLTYNKAELDLSKASDCIVKNCEFSDKTSYCLVQFYKGGSNNTLIFNQIKNNTYNTYGGIRFYKGGANNRIYLNNFQNNIKDVYASQMSNTVFWHSPEPLTYIYNGKTFSSYMGNYWDKYTGIDANGDGIGDAPYDLGNLGQDEYPLMAPFENYTISESPSELFFEPSDVLMTGPGDKTEMQLLVDELPEGFSSYVLTLNVTDPEIARISGVDFPAWANTTSSTETPAASVEINASDLNQQIESGASNVTLATIDLEALGYGAANITVNVEGFKDDSENPILFKTMEASLKIPDSDWPEFQKDSYNSGYGLCSVPTRDPEVLWQSLTSPKQEPCGSGGINVPPVISGNTVFVTAGNASVWAFNKDTGELIWSKEMGGNLVQTATPALGDGKLFVPTLEGDLYALDPENGNELWKAHVTDGSLESPLTYSDHKLYIVDGLEGGNGTKYYYCYDDNGSYVWKHENTNTSGFIWNGAVVVGNYLVYPVFEGKMVCLEKDTGTFVDEVDFRKSSDVSFALSDPGMFRSSVTYANGALYTSSERGQEKGYCFKAGFNPDTGQFLDSGWAASIGFSTSTPVVYNSRVYVGHGEHGETGSMFCLNDSDGSVIWETPISGGVKSSPVISVKNGNPYIYFTEAISDGSIYCLNPDGTLAWHYNPPADEAYTLQGAALSDDKVYYGTDNGYLYCIGQGDAIPPTANFSSNKQTGSFPLTISFKDRSVNANKFLWDFGDGNTSTEVNPVHTYTAEGTYTVTLTVQNEHGTDQKVADEYIYAVRVPVTCPVKSGESIQAAIYKASPGDIIKVYPGEYHEVLTINKALTLKGIRDPVLNASGFTGEGISGITVSADDVEISGFEITGTEEMCFAINVTAKNALIEDNLIDNCAEGVWLKGTGNTIRRNNISNCWDFAAVLDAAGGNRIYQNTFINNSGAYEGSSSHISGGSGSFFQSPEQVEYLWEGAKLTGYMGNYYDDYTGSDSNGDGIGDTAYAADKGTDQYPLVMTYSNYVEKENNSIPEDSWFQFHGKIDHLGYSESGPKTNRTEWISEDIDAISSSSPVVADGKVFVICGGEGMEGSAGEIPQLVALNKSTGNVVWNAAIPAAVYGSWASPAYDNGMVFTATGPELGCYDAETGEKLWSFNNTVGSKGVVNSGPAVADGMVIFSDWDGSYYYCLDDYTGYLLWSFKVTGDGQSAPVYADGKFYLTSWNYGASNQGHAYCVDAVTGEQVWHINVEQNFCGSPAYKDGVLYLTTYNFYGMGDLLALNARDGSIIWQQNIQSTDSTPALAYGNIYVCGGASSYSNVQTYCFNATTGEPVWSTTPKTTEAGGIGDWTCSVTVANGLVYVGSAGDGYFGYINLYALDAFNGNVVWHAPYAGSSPALSDGMLFSIGGNQKVYAFKDSLISPIADFTAAPISGNAPLAVNFSDQSTGSPASWFWDFGDGTNATEQNVLHTYMEAGNYTVNLTVANTGGSDSEVKTGYITVSESSTPTEPTPIAAFTVDVTSGTAPLTVNFTDQSTGSPTSWSWDFGDGANTTERNVSHAYDTEGTYTVYLTVSNENGTNSTSIAITVTAQAIPAKPVAAFSADTILGIMPLNVQFTDLSTGVPSTWSWNFGDGNTSIEQHPSHTYSRVGKFTVKLTVKNALGSNSTTKISYIDVKVAPLAEFSANKTVGKIPMSVKFTDRSTGAPTSWNWDFGDGNASTEKSPTNVYGAVGRYNVTLTATNAVGNNTVTKYSYIDVEAVPLANFTADPTVGIMPLSVSFTDLSTGAPTSWKWNFGDGTNSTEQNPSHIYSKVGKFTVSLIAKNAVGSNTSRKTKLIDVEIVPVADFTANKTVGKLPMSVKFTDKSTGAPTSWNWDFGDGNTSTEERPEHVYGAVGRYNVTFTATNAVGTNTTTKLDYIDVEIVPISDFSATPTIGAVPLNVSFTDLSSGTPTSWKWEFGDGNTSTEQNLSHIYSKGGQYTVKLTAKNVVGSNTSIKTKLITVEFPPVASFSASPTSGTAPLNVSFTDRSTGYPESWNWEFRDGSTSTEKNPAHTFSTAGRYTVNLTVTNLAGSSTKSVLKYIKVS